ncbi:MAG: hypothetical protein AAFO99_08890 [Bacteroidota bacterium]
MIEQTYLAGQYLAAAAISFIKKVSDDSHTNLGFSIENASMYTRPLNSNGDTLVLNYNTFALEWHSKNYLEVLGLDGNTHNEVIKWIGQKAKKGGMDTPYRYEFHYDPTYVLSDGFIFKLSDANKFRELRDLRILGQQTFTFFLKEQKLTSEIRVWPHHFDTGAFALLNEDSGKAIGLGLSIPDALVDDHYFYISGYKGHEGLDTSGFPSLTYGKWQNEGFKGAILPATDIDENAAMLFFREALMAYKI